MEKAILAAMLLVAGVALRSVGQAEDSLAVLVPLLAQTDDAQFQLDLLKGMSAGLQGKRNVPKPAGWEKVAATLSASPNPQVRDLTRALSLTFGSATALGEWRSQLANSKAKAEDRRKALETLLANKDPELGGQLPVLLNDSALRSDALRAMAVYEDPKTPEVILELYPKLSISEKRDALGTLVARPLYAKALLRALGAKLVPARDLTADLVRALRLHRDPDMNRQIEALWGVTRESGQDKQQQIAMLKAKLQKLPPGDPRRGRVVFERICQQCHTLFDAGGKVGPDITGSNRADLDYILHNILDPNAEIPNEYRPSVIETKDDRLITGIVTRQDDNVLTVITANETLTLPRAEARSVQQSELSMMPEGLVETLTEGELRDLIAYLGSPAQVPLP